jgi:hypothetical protein
MWKKAFVFYTEATIPNVSGCSNEAIRISTEQAGLAITLQTRNWEVISSNLEQVNV